jgi:hypothetical protein
MRAGRLPLPGLEAFPAKYRASLGGPERHRGFPSALRTVGRRLYLAVAARSAFLALPLARFAALGLVPEVLIGEELLFSRRKHKIRITIDTLEYSILKLWHLPGSCLPCGYRTTLGKAFSDPPLRGCRSQTPVEALYLFEIPATFLPVPFTGQCLLNPFPFPRLQIERMLLDFFNDVFLLYFPFEPAKGVL